MILNLNNELFKTKPLDVYIKYGINNKEWNNIWYKRKFLDYKTTELLEYITTILHKDISYKLLSRCLLRYEVYLLTQSLFKKGETSIHISYYPEACRSFIKDYLKKENE